MARQEYTQSDDFRFPSREELSQGRVARITERFRMPIPRTAIPGYRILMDARIQAAAGGMAFLLFGYIAFESIVQPEERTPAFMLVLLAGLGLVLGYGAIVTSLWVMSTSSRRPIVGLLLGSLALLLGLSIPALEARAGSYFSPPVDPANCEHNISALCELLERYENETGLELDYGRADFLKPVWERYRYTEADTFFCSESSAAQRILERGAEFSQAEFREISFSGGLFHPDMRLTEGAAKGPPLLWEKENAHGVLGVQVYTVGTGSHRSSPNVLFARISAFRDLQAAERREIARQAAAAELARTGALEGEAGLVGADGSSAAHPDPDGCTRPADAAEEIRTDPPAALPR